MGSKARHTYSTGSIVLQVPEHNFTMLVDQVRHSGVATSVVTSANDVTSQYVDLQARISALKVSRAQYLKIMTRTNSINGILAVQNQLDNIQSQIEQLQGQLNLLNSETTYATLTVSLTEAGHLVNPPTHPATGVDKAWHESLHGFAAGVEWLIRIAGPLLFALSAARRSLAVRSLDVASHRASTRRHQLRPESAAPVGRSSRILRSRNEPRRYHRVMSGVTPDQRPTREGEIATERVRAICMDLPQVIERLSHGEASWFINDKKNFVAMSDHHHDDRVSVTFAAGAGVQESLIDRTRRTVLSPPLRRRARMGRCLSGRPR